MRIIQRDCVVAIVQSADGKILLGKKDPASGGVYPDCWHLPGGGIEEGETQHKALRREVWEETGIDIASYQMSFVDGSGTGEAEKKDKESSETVLCKMQFYVYTVNLPMQAAAVPLRPQSEFKQIAWAGRKELANYWLTPPSMTLFTKLGYM